MGYSNVRDPDFLGTFIGKRIAEILQHDKDEWEEERVSYVQILFDDGSWVKFMIRCDECKLEVHEE